MSFLPGRVTVRNCQRSLELCAMPLAATYMGMSEEEVLQTLINTDLQETCM